MRGYVRFGVLLIALSCVTCSEKGEQVWVSAASNGDLPATMVVQVPNLEAIPAWHLSPEPLFRVSLAGDTSDIGFTDIGVCLPTADGGFFVSNRTSPLAVYEFSREGELVRSFGREGRGPGEYKGPPIPFPYRGDSLAIWDGEFFRLTIFGPDGEAGRTLSLPGSLGPLPMRISQGLPDGGFIAFRSAFSLKHPDHADGWEQTPAVRLHPDGSVKGILGRFPTVELRLGPNGQNALLGLGGRGLPLPTEDGFVWLKTDNGELRFINSDGSVRRVIRLSAERRRLTKESWARYVRESQLTQSSGQRTALDFRMIEKLVERPFAAHAPILERGFVASDSLIWIELFRFPWEQSHRLLMVTYPEGRIVRLSVPEEKRVLAIFPNNRILLEGELEIGGGVLEMYPIQKGSPFR